MTEMLKSRTGLLMHEKWKHPELSTSATSSASLFYLSSPPSPRERSDEMEVAVLVKELVTEVEKRDCQEKISSYSYSFRMDVLNEIENGMAPVDAALKFRVSESSVLKWTKNKKLIVARAADQHAKFPKREALNQVMISCSKNYLQNFGLAVQREGWYHSSGSIRQLRNFTKRPIPRV